MDRATERLNEYFLSVSRREKERFPTAQAGPSGRSGMKKRKSAYFVRNDGFVAVVWSRAFKEERAAR
jgi:hypothetical protein